MADHSNPDRDLLLRLNALRRSHINLDDGKAASPVASSASLPLNSDPAKALYSDLSARFQSLKGSGHANDSRTGSGKYGTPLDIPELQNENDDKTVEELLAELGPEDQWTVGKDDEIEIEELLKHAKGVLQPAHPEKSNGVLDMEPQNRAIENGASALDVSVFQSEADSEGEDEKRLEDGKPVSIDCEADETLQRLLDEIKHDSDQAADNESVAGDESSSAILPGLELPSAPQAEPIRLEPGPEPSDLSSLDLSLATRFASLGMALPSVPSTIKGSCSSTTQPADDEIDTWCIICLSDATLSCLGCDGDLYCSDCWMEGHRGESAGYEEKRHRAVRFVKPDGKEKKIKGKRTMVGA